MGAAGTPTTIALKGQDGPSGYAGASLDQERERARARADADYKRREANLTPEQREQRGVVLALLSRLKVAQNKQRRETARRIQEVESDAGTGPVSEADSDESSGGESVSGGGSGTDHPGLISRAAARIKAEVAEQFAHEIRELKKQIAEQKQELRAMLQASS